MPRSDAKADQPPEMPPPESDPRPVSRARQLVFWLLLAAAAGALFEVAARVGYFVADGFNPYYLVFGLVADTEHHSLEADGYSKFQPDTVKRQKHVGRVIPMQINSSGFRRTGDGDPLDADFRIATLGASSTFGYYVEDDEAYPAVLERMLRETVRDRNVQVYNLGIPHLRIENIVELARHELPRIRPQVVTLYCGYNNVGLPNLQKTGQASGVKNWLHFHSVLYRLLRPAIKRAYFSLVEATNKDIAQLGHLSLPIELSADQVAELEGQLVSDFAAHLEALHGLIEHSGAELVLVTQNYSLSRRGASGFDDPSRPYDQEVRRVEARLAESGRISAVESSLLIHRGLMDRFRALARQRGVRLVDGIAAMARDPSEMKSGVHLSVRGNQWIAEAIYREVLPLANGG